MKCASQLWNIQWFVHTEISVLTLTVRKHTNSVCKNCIQIIPQFSRRLREDQATPVLFVHGPFKHNYKMWQHLRCTSKLYVHVLIINDTSNSWIWTGISHQYFLGLYNCTIRLTDWLSLHHIRQESAQYWDTDTCQVKRLWTCKFWW